MELDTVDARFGVRRLEEGQDDGVRLDGGGAALGHAVEAVLGVGKLLEWLKVLFLQNEAVVEHECPDIALCGLAQKPARCGLLGDESDLQIAGQVICVDLRSMRL